MGRGLSIASLFRSACQERGLSPPGPLTRAGQPLTRAALRSPLLQLQAPNSCCNAPNSCWVHTLVLAFPRDVPVHPVQRRLSPPVVENNGLYRRAWTPAQDPGIVDVTAPSVIPNHYTPSPYSEGRGLKAYSRLVLAVLIFSAGTVPQLPRRAWRRRHVAHAITRA